MPENADYDTDILTWSERQAALLRRVAAGSRSTTRSMAQYH